MSTVTDHGTYTVTEHRGEDVLPWMQPESQGSTLPTGSRLCTFSEYAQAPEGTRVRMGRRGNLTNPIRVKEGGSWRVENPAEGEYAPTLTNYGIENSPSYVL